MRGTEGKVCGVLAQHVTRNGVVQYMGEGSCLGDLKEVFLSVSVRIMAVGVVVASDITGVRTARATRHQQPLLPPGHAR